MAASQRRMNGSWVRLAHAAILCTLILHNGVLSQDTDGEEGDAPPLLVITESPELLDALSRGDNDFFTDGAEAGYFRTTPGFTDPGADDDSDAAADPGAMDPTAKGGAVTSDPQFSVNVQTIFDLDGVTAAAPGEVPIKGDGEEPWEGVQCVDKEALKNKNVVKLQLNGTSSCEESKAELKELLGDLCEHNCNLKIFQEEGSSEIIVSGDIVEADAKGMAAKFESEPVKEKLGVVEASPRWGKRPSGGSAVLVSLLLTGLILAAVLIGGYCLRNHRSQPAKGSKLAQECFPADQENQGNTLVSVAPLHPQEPRDKPSANGESPEGVKTEAPPTNGHSATKSPVADTEL